MFLKINIAGLICLLFLLWCPDKAKAFEPESIEFDIIRVDQYLSVLLNLEPFVSSKRVQQMKQGIDFAVEYEISLFCPKKVWGANKINKKTGIYKIGYRLITENYYLSNSAPDYKEEKYFFSLAELHQFLTDSIIIKQIEFDKLNKHNRYYIEIEVACISLTSFNLATDEINSNKPQSPIKFLFQKFLEMTNFGRKEFKTKSRLFSIDEITSNY